MKVVVQKTKACTTMLVLQDHELFTKPIKQLQNCKRIESEA